MTLSDFIEVTVHKVPLHTTPNFKRVILHNITVIIERKCFILDTSTCTIVQFMDMS